jgi:hypothetical protein
MLGKRNKFYIWVLKQNMGFQKHTRVSITKEEVGFQVLAGFTFLSHVWFWIYIKSLIIPNLLMLHAFQIRSPTPSILTQCSNSLAL